MPPLTVEDIQNAQFGFCRTAITAMGVELKLFEVLAQPDKESGWSPAEIAQRLSLKERYVTEWCRAAVNLGLIDRIDGDRYSTPPETLCSIQAAGPHSVLLSTVLGAFGMVRDAFSITGPLGVGYEHFTDFHRVERMVTRERFDARLVQDWLPMLSIWSQLTSGESGLRVLDVGCGSGHAINVMAARFPEVEFVGVDLSEEAISTAIAEASDMGLRNAHFCVHDICGTAPCPPLLTRPFDLVLSFMVIHDLPKPVEAVQWIGAALKVPSGVFAMMEVDDTTLTPNERGFYYTASLLHCMTTSLAQPGGAGLGNVMPRDGWKSLIEDQAGLQIRECLAVPGERKKGLWVVTPREESTLP